jgi:hypothetical protein
MHATLPAHLIILDLITLTLFGKAQPTNYEALHYVIFSNLLSLLEHPVLKHPHSMFLPLGEGQNVGVYPLEI